MQHDDGIGGGKSLGSFAGGLGTRVAGRAGVVGHLVLLLLVVLAGFSFLGARAWGAEQDWFVYPGNTKPPKAPRKNINAAEALPPLPLPATPLRRTERKKPPQPDYLVGKVIWGEDASFTASSGEALKIADWNLCPTDLASWMETVRAMALNYHWRNVNLGDFDYDAGKLPCLLFSGVRTLRLGAEQKKRLREYVLGGGMVVCDSIAGSPYFYDSVKVVFGEVFPECRFRVLPV